MTTADLLLAACMFLGAVLYTSVGHAGASAYLALMALFGLPPAVMRPTALVLNILVASLTSFRYARAGLFRWRVLWPFLIGAAPFALFGGSLHVPGDAYRPLVGAVLWLSAARLLWPKEIKAVTDPHDPPIAVAIPLGAGIGLLSGLTGTGGGIFLSPLVLFLGWANPKVASGVAAVFILCNSMAGLSGNFASVQALPDSLPLFAGSVLAGAVVGTTFGIRFNARVILKALGLVLLVAGFKLMDFF
ncbi:MAG TPA: sulfite exporter TauE/SafE family protein [Croceibacterium sp.]|nr:sulfite exporter TauE/SafE family protein [Croceibacterium sp.]